MVARVHSQPMVQLPDSEQELERCLRDPEWRLFSGCLYKIMVKGDDGDDSYSCHIRSSRPGKSACWVATYHARCSRSITQPMAASMPSKYSCCSLVM